jgi:putative Mn2+ efflux pump MntP
MSLLEIVLIAIGLSMDAFAVSITLGLSVERLRVKEIVMPGLYFGAFQALMPCIGYFTSLFFANKIQHIDHWIAFVFLGFIGGKMIKDGFSKEVERKGNSFQCMKMLFLAIATSIDALAVGITFAFFKIDIIVAIIITGLTTFFVSMCGVRFGNILGIRFKTKAELIGGSVLVILGAKILMEHLFFDIV